MSSLYNKQDHLLLFDSVSSTINTLDKLEADVVVDVAAVVVEAWMSNSFEPCLVFWITTQCVSSLPISTKEAIVRGHKGEFTLCSCMGFLDLVNPAFAASGPLRTA